MSSRNANFTHWGRVMHIHVCVGNLTIIGSDNVLSPGRHQASVWTHGILLIGHIREILIEIQSSSLKKSTFENAVCGKFSISFRTQCLIKQQQPHWTKYRITNAHFMPNTHKHWKQAAGYLLDRPAYTMETECKNKQVSPSHIWNSHHNCSRRIYNVA